MRLFLRTFLRIFFCAYFCAHIDVDSILVVNIRYRNNTADIIQTNILQFLLTDDFRVVLNDVDELIAASSDGKVRCNCNIIRGGSEFSDGEGMGCLVPPEQKKCGTNVFYTEKIDIWKIPDITAAILGESVDSLNLWNHLYHIHQECKLDDPTLRPPIEYVVAKYREVQHQFQIETGL